MKNCLYFLFSIGTLFLMYSCNKQRFIPVQKAISNNSCLVQFDKTKSYKEVSLYICNPSTGPSDFYITPLDINLFSDSAIVNELSNHSASIEQKAINLWKFVCDWTYHSQPLSTNDQAINDPAIMFNGFQFGICDDRNAVLSNLARFSGIPARVYELNGHVVSELYYDSTWHMFDADKHVFFSGYNRSIASVDYLSKYPEVISAKSNQLSKLAERIRNHRTRRAIASSEDNNVNVQYDLNESKYTSTIQLLPGNGLFLKSEKTTTFSKLLHHDLFSRNGPDYCNTGKKLQTIDLGSSTKNTQGHYVIQEKLPYPVQSIHLTISGPYKIYFSSDGETWYFKGFTNTGKNQLSFTPFNNRRAPYIFDYKIKLVPLSSTITTSQDKCDLESKFSFSDKILLNNYSRAFKVVYLNKAALDMDIRVWSIE